MKLLLFPFRCLYWIGWFYYNALLIMVSIFACGIAVLYEMSRSRRERIMYEQL